MSPRVQHLVTIRLAFILLVVGFVTSCGDISPSEPTTHSEVTESRIWSWGVNRYAELGRGQKPVNVGISTPYVPGPVAYQGKPIDLVAGWRHCMVLGQDGSVVAWGENGSGQVGTGRLGGNVWSPIKIPGLTGVVDVAAGSFHSVAVMSDGTVQTWGQNGKGELGNGRKTDSSRPAKVLDLNGVKAVAAGDGFTIALADDGTVWTWGDNTYGQLGDGTTNSSAKPVHVPGLKNVKSIACGRFRCTALRADGTVWNWGYNWYGELADGTETQQSVPVQAQGIDNVQSIACGPHHTLAVKKDGTVWAWGYGYKGELGIRGFDTQTGTPRQIPGLSNIAIVAAGWDFSMALGYDGSLWAWGRNWYGQYGIKNPRESDVPVKLVAITGVSKLACRTGHTIAIMVDP